MLYEHLKISEKPLNKIQQSWGSVYNWVLEHLPSMHGYVFIPKPWKVLSNVLQCTEDPMANTQLTNKKIYIKNKHLLLRFGTKLGFLLLTLLFSIILNIISRETRQENEISKLHPKWKKRNWIFSVCREYFLIYRSHSRFYQISVKINKQLQWSCGL